MSRITKTFYKILNQLQKMYSDSNPSFEFNQEVIIEALKKENLDKNLYQRLYEEFLGSGPLYPLIQDCEVTEIILDGKDSIFYEKNQELIHHPDQFLSKWTFENFIHKICEESKSSPSLESPFTNGKWNHFRVHIITPPLVKHQPHITLRKHPRESWTFEKLKKQEWSNNEGINILKNILQKKLNLLIVGPTSSGKTSVLNACLQFLPSNERMILIEDTDELICPNPTSVKLLTRSSAHLPCIDQSSLVVQSLRMRPDRLVMGEVRGKEAKDLIMALATGHRGSIGTLHADHHKQALLRLELLMQSSDAHWNTDSIRGLIQLGLQAIVIVKKENQQRYLSGIYQITGLEKSGFLFECLFQSNTQLIQPSLTHLRGGFGHQASSL